MERDSTLNLLWLGRMSEIKMNISPKINFLFQMILLNIQEKTLKDWQKQINWNGKKPRIRFKVLQEFQKVRSLVVPNIKLILSAIQPAWAELQIGSKAQMTD